MKNGNLETSKCGLCKIRVTNVYWLIQLYFAYVNKINFNKLSIFGSTWDRIKNNGSLNYYSFLRKWIELIVKNPESLTDLSLNEFNTDRMLGVRNEWNRDNEKEKKPKIFVDYTTVTRNKVEKNSGECSVPLLRAWFVFFSLFLSRSPVARRSRV